MGRWECEVVSAAHGPEDDHTKGDLGHVTICRTGMAPGCIHYLWGKESHGTRLFFFFSILRKKSSMYQDLSMRYCKSTNYSHSDIW